ncbi:MAG: FAD-dependent oxidoreductase, partial [Candidatus Thiodiazotropha taylori]
IFIEPEGLDTHEIYPNGISTSLPFDIQYQLVRSMKGFENAHITRPGYAIEYDFFDPRDLKSSLQTKFIDGLFFAGQINGTTGYEEAAAQGLLAGINAVRFSKQLEPWSPRRDEAYLGVLVDDLITQGTQEPYRMFTSRAEYRLLLREDNADLRLTETGRQLGVVDDQRWEIFCRKRENIEREQQRLKELWLRPTDVDTEQAENILGGSLSKEASAQNLLARPNVSYRQLMTIARLGPGLQEPQEVEQLEVQAKYAGYIARQQGEIDKQRANESVLLPEDLDYTNVRGLSSEVREKFQRHRPETLGQAGRIPGVTPAAISLLLIHLKKRSA